MITYSVWRRMRGRERERGKEGGEREKGKGTGLGTKNTFSCGDMLAT